MGSQMLERMRSLWTSRGWVARTSSMRYSPMLPRSMAKSVTDRPGSGFPSMRIAERRTPATHPSVLSARISISDGVRLRP